MGLKNKQVLMMLAIELLLLLAVINGSFSYAIAPAIDDHLPIVLIHGYAQDYTVWNTWVRWLEKDNFSNIYPIRFQHDDDCGSAQQHASELRDIIDSISKATGHEQVNIVAHSKGGLDARGYLATGTHKVANLIMIGTPNAGSMAAYWDATSCLGAADDLFPGSQATLVKNHPENTNYLTIAGNWLPDIWCPSPVGIIPDGGNCLIYGEDDGLVAVKSVMSSPEYMPLGEFPYDHFNLLRQRDVYETALTVLDRQ